MGINDRDYMRMPRWPRRTYSPHRRRRRRTFVIAGALVALLYWWRPDPSQWPALLRSVVERNAAPVNSERIVVDINTATPWELKSIPYISDAIAKQIVRERPFESVDQLIRVKGIGPVTLEKIRKHVRVGTPTNVEAPTDHGPGKR